MPKLSELARVCEYDALTDLWIEILGGDVPYNEMIEVFKILFNKGEVNLASELLELTIAEKEDEEENSFSAFLMDAAPLFRESEPLRKALIETVRDENLMFRPLEYFLKLSGLTKKNADVKSSWLKFTSLMHYREKGYLYHYTFGVGRIKKLSRTHVAIDFQKAVDHYMKLDVAIETTIPLPSDSLSVLSWVKPDEFSLLFNESTSLFLKRLFDDPLTGSEGVTLLDIRPFFADSEFTDSEAWKILKKAVTRTEGFADLGDRIVLLDENVEILDQVKNIINRKKESLSEKIKQILSLLKSHGKSFPDGLPGLLPDLQNIRSPETGSMFELCWILTNRGTSEEFTRLYPDCLETTAARGERALGEIRSQSCRKTWLNLFFLGNIERKEKVKLLSGLRRALWEHAVSILEESDPDLLSECIGDYLSKPSETDRFLWALSFLASREEIQDEGMGDNQTSLFLDNLIFSSADTQKKVIRLLLGPLKQKLNSYLASIDSRKLSNYLDSFMTSATAQNEGLCLHLGRSLSLRKNSTIRKSVKNFFWETDGIFSSRKSIEQRKLDTLKLKQVEIPAAADAIGEAASHGDLSENAEYAAAIERRDLLLDRLNRWTKELQRYRVYPVDEISSDRVSPGIRIQLQENGGSEKVQILDVVGPLDADPENGRINYMAPLAKAVLGKSQGDIVILQEDDSKEWRIASLEILDLVEQ